jgi:hypothetical protein
MWMSFNFWRKILRHEAICKCFVINFLQTFYLVLQLSCQEQKLIIYIMVMASNKRNRTLDWQIAAVDKHWAVTQGNQQTIGRHKQLWGWEGRDVCVSAYLPLWLWLPGGQSVHMLVFTNTSNCSLIQRSWLETWALIRGQGYAPGSV